MGPVPEASAQSSVRRSHTGRRHRMNDSKGFKGMSHFGLDVDDLARSEAFYTEVLGGHVLWRLDGRMPHMDVVIGDHAITIFQGERGKGSLSARTVPRGVHFAFAADP